MDLTETVQVHSVRILALGRAHYDDKKNKKIIFLSHFSQKKLEKIPNPNKKLSVFYVNLSSVADFAWSANITVQTISRSGATIDVPCGKIDYTGNG